MVNPDGCSMVLDHFILVLARQIGSSCSKWLRLILVGQTLCDYIMVLVRILVSWLVLAGQIHTYKYVLGRQIGIGYFQPGTSGQIGSSWSEWFHCPMDPFWLVMLVLDGQI